LEERLSIELDGTEVDYRVRRSLRARRVRVIMSVTEGLVVVVPHRMRIPTPPPILIQEREWVLRQWNRWGARVRRERGLLLPGDLVPVDGRPRTVLYGPQGSARPLVTVDDRSLWLRPQPASPREAFRVVCAWLRDTARCRFLAAIDDLDPEGRFRFSRITVRDQRTRWGSCSSRGVLSLNWRLIMAPPDVLRYVVAHELAHTRELRHSARFWAIVEEVCPDAQSHRRWLGDHGHELRL